MSDIISELSTVVDAEWARIREGKFFTSQGASFDLAVYVETMLQIFHYTKNNAINQAAAAYGADHRKIGLLRFAFRHALEELGHERMIVKDLAAVGISEEVILRSKPLPATEALNGYLYTVALKEGLVARLGYSFWAEDAYEYIQPLLLSARKALKLEDASMTFFVAHSSIDEKHSKEVRDAIVAWAVTEEDREALKRVARTTLYLTGQILDSAYDEVMRSRSVPSGSFRGAAMEISH